MLTPTVIGQYRIEALLGEGRYAQTYRATDTVRRRVVAFKLLRPELLANPAGWERLLESVRPAAELVHPHLTWLWEAGESDGNWFLAERYAGGPNLAQTLSNSGPPGWPAARQALGQLVQGLEFAASRQWVHGDIHPGNIILSPELGAVLTDFTLARLAQRLPGGPLPQPDRVADGANRGPFSWQLYQAPEVRLGEPAEMASDLYSLACALLEMLTGQPLSAIPGASQPAVDDPDAPEASSAAPDPLAAPALPSAWPPGAPVGLEAVLQRALALEPAERYPSPAAFLEALDRLQPTSSDEVQLRAWRVQQAEARRWTEDEARRRAEDAARLVALEQARREIAAQVSQPASAESTPVAGKSPVGETPAAEAQTAQAAGAPPSPATDDAARRRRTRRSTGRRLWPLWLGLIAIAILLAGLWSAGGLPVGRIIAPTPTATSPSATWTPATPPTTTPAPPATATATITPTITATVTLTAKPTLTPTATPTFTVSPTPLPTDTPTSSPTATRILRPTSTLGPKPKD